MIYANAEEDVQRRDFYDQRTVDAARYRSEILDLVADARGFASRNYSRDWRTRAAVSKEDKMRCLRAVVRFATRFGLKLKQKRSAPIRRSMWKKCGQISAESVSDELTPQLHYGRGGGGRIQVAGSNLAPDKGFSAGDWRE